MLSSLMIIACSVLAGQVPVDSGAIEGTVWIVSDGRRVGADVEVVLRVAWGGEFVPLAETRSDEHGRFYFAPLPLGADFIYLPGANRDGIHYPGQRVVLSPQHFHESVELEVRDTLESPCPLVIRRHEVLIRPKPGAVSVSEKIVVDNPTSKCYVGRSEQEGVSPVTLALSIPADFEQTTFEREFFGRRFSMLGGKLSTSIPWQPGERELNFTYVLRNDRDRFEWQRPIDLPCSQLALKVECDQPETVRCSLGPATVQNGLVVFESDVATLQPGDVVRIELGELPRTFMTYGRWLAPVALLLLIAAAMIVKSRRRRAPIATSEPRPIDESRQGEHPSSGRPSQPVFSRKAKRARHRGKKAGSQGRSR